MVKVDYEGLPESLRPGVKLYIEQGIIPGDFLRSVICNNLSESFMFADPMNKKRMDQIVDFFRREAPAVCWGSKEKMRAWLRRHKLAQELRPGTQIIYVPNHAKDENDPVCEHGFVMTVNLYTVFCRYWNKDGTDLRTRANSESTPFENIVVKDTHPQYEVDRWIRKLMEEA